MSKLFSVASWNIEHFGKDESDAGHARVKRAIQFLKAQNPDVFALYEVEGKEVFRTLFEDMPGYTFHITEGPQVQEILVGVRSNFTAFFTQKIEFKSGVTLLRPGSLLTLFIDGEYFPMLFLHTKSGNDARGFGLRDDMLHRSIKFKSVLNRTGGDVNYIIMGDLNTMGMKYPSGKSVPPEIEIKRLDGRARHHAYRMRLLSKTHYNTFSNGSASSTPPSPLDHVVAARHMKFKEFDNAKGKGEVDVRGWADFTDPAEQDQWIKDFSDHCLLYFEVERP
jgi:hypothetical protein